MAKSIHFTNPIYFGTLILLVTVNQIQAAALKDNGRVLNVAVIGAGTSGLVSAKHLLAQGYNVTVYEQSADFGGTWYYTNETGKDKYGLNVHSSIYQGLGTIEAAENMQYTDYPYPLNASSHPEPTEVFNYLHSYADHFGVTKHIKLNHHVVRVLPIENGKWEIIVRDLPNNTFETVIYDVVFVATGHFSKPRYPNVPGANVFNGKFIHSHDFRLAETFRGDSVLVIGGGRSGKDIVHLLSKTATRITFSQHKRNYETEEEREERQSAFPSNVRLQENVKRFTPTGAEFIDGTHQTFSAIICATGYNYSYPFLSVDTGITVVDNLVRPLYMQMINIEHPTMVFIGVPNGNAPHFDLQVQWVMKIITGKEALPSKSDMFKHLHACVESIYKLRTLLKMFTSSNSYGSILSTHCIPE